MASNVDRNLKFSERIFSLLQYSRTRRQRPGFSVHSALMTKTDLTFPVSSIRFEDFAVQPFTVYVHSMTSDARFMFDSSVIIFDQAQFFALGEGIEICNCNFCNTFIN